MKIEGIQLPDDWRELVEQLVDADGLFTAVVVSDPQLDKALLDGGFIAKNARGGTYGTPKLQLWWNTHRDYEDPPTLSHTWTYRLEYSPYEDDVWDPVDHDHVADPFGGTLAGLREKAKTFAPHPTRIVKTETIETVVGEED